MCAATRPACVGGRPSPAHRRRKQRCYSGRSHSLAARSSRPGVSLHAMHSSSSSRRREKPPPDQAFGRQGSPCILQRNEPVPHCALRFRHQSIKLHEALRHKNLLCPRMPLHIHLDSFQKLIHQHVILHRCGELSFGKTSKLLLQGLVLECQSLVLNCQGLHLF